MPKFLLAYHGAPDIKSKEEGAAHMKAWQAWSDGLGAAVIDPGMPVGSSVTITAGEVIQDGGANPISGITILKADTMQDAIDMAKDCPHLSGSGTIEIAEAREM